MDMPWLLIFASVTALTTTLFLFVAVLWLRKLRLSVLHALKESATQQVLTAQRFGEAIEQLQKRQIQQEQQLYAMAQASLRLRQELNTVSNRMDSAEREMYAQPGDRVLH